MRLSIVCPHCRSARPGERAQVGDHIVTLCYCSSCGVTWTRENDEPAPPAPKRRRRQETAPAASHEPAPTDLLVRGSFTQGYELVEAASGRPVASGLGSLEEVLVVAQQYGGAIWQQQADRFGRPMGKPIRLTLQAQ